jgi:transketolase
MSESLNKKMADCIRILSMDAVQQANSGHPGLPMGMADVTTVLYSKFINHYPLDPEWVNRDRFVLSAGHGSALLYSLLHLTGYEDFSLQQLQQFRQLNSLTAGHPEYGHGRGIETTTGPLGQGFANAVGMAIAEKKLQIEFGEELINHRTYTIMGDGCLMEGISYEAAALAGHYKLNKLIALWDDNQITIDGSVSLSSSENILMRFEAAGWQVLSCDGHNFQEIEKAIATAQQSTDKPVFIACKTIIGKGSPNKAGTSATHGAPLGDEEIALTRQNLGWESQVPFEIPPELMDEWHKIGQRSFEDYQQWKQIYNAHSQKEEFARRISGKLSHEADAVFQQIKEQISTEKPKMATRQSSQYVLNHILPKMPELLGGSADLTGSNLTRGSEQVNFVEDVRGSYIHYGIREHSMAAIMNGIALHGGYTPYGGTFLVFSDYCRPAMRLAALMNVRVIYVMTHDSIGVGEDGPTHQPVETMTALRCIPNLLVFRPCDTIETAECWQLSLQNQGSKASVLALSRQGLPTLRSDATEQNSCRYGGYILRYEQTTNQKLHATILASGSEVSNAVEAQEELQKKGLNIRVVSVPCIDLFSAQTSKYRKEVIGDYEILASIEAGLTQSWQALRERPDISIGIESFGASAPGNQVFEKFGITTKNLVEQIEQKLCKN